MAVRNEGLGMISEIIIGINYWENISVGKLGESESSVLFQET